MAWITPKLDWLPSNSINAVDWNRIENNIAGEAGAEMIVPLENTSFTDKIASALGTAVMTAMQLGQGNNNGGNNEIALQLDGVTFARLIHPYSARENARIGGSMITVR